MIKSALLLSILLLLSLSNHSQDIHITGKVVNSNLDPVKSVQVHLKSNPELICYTDENGEFNLTNQSTAIGPVTSPNEYIRQLPDGSLELYLGQKNLSMSFIDIQGRILETITHKDLDGIYRVSPQAYLYGLPEGIYIVRIQIGNQFFGYKYSSTHAAGFSKGLYLIASLDPGQIPALKQAAASEDSLVFTSDFYRKARLYITQMEGDVGTVQLENFGDYELPENFTPDQAIISGRNGGFVHVLGQDSSAFTFFFDPKFSPNQAINTRAIPIKNIPEISDSLNIISAVHIESDEKEFTFPIFVTIKLNNVDVSDSLVVFIYDHDLKTVYYLPYMVEEGYLSKNISFYAPHFSTVGVGIDNTLYYTPEDGARKEAEAYIQAITLQLKMGMEIDLGIYSSWYDNIVEPAIMVINDYAGVRNAALQLTLLGHYAVFANMELSQFEFYAGALELLSEKIKSIYDEANLECIEQKESCLKREMFQIAIDLSDIAQRFGLNSLLTITDFCNGMSETFIDDLEVETKYLHLKVNGVHQLGYTCKSINNEQLGDTAVVWYSEDPTIASVDQNGVIKGNKPGGTRIFAQLCELKSYCYVFVENEESYYCGIKSGRYSGRLFLYGHEYPWGDNAGHEYLNVAVDISFNRETGMFLATYLKVWRIDHMKYWGNGIYYVDYVDVTSLYGQIEDITCYDYGFYKTDYGQLGSLYLYPEAGRIEITGYTFHDQYLSSTGSLY